MSQALYTPTHLEKASLTTVPGNLSCPQMVAGEKRQDSPRASCLVGGELTDRANNLWWFFLFPEAPLLSWCCDQGRAAHHSQAQVSTIPARLRGFRSEHLRREPLIFRAGLMVRAIPTQVGSFLEKDLLGGGVAQCLGTPWVSGLRPAPLT